jgi:hypothetical protein
VTSIAGGNRVLHGTKIEPERHGPAGLRTFVNIAHLWNLGIEEQMALLGISERSIFDDWTARAQSHSPVTIDPLGGHRADRMRLIDLRFARISVFRRMQRRLAARTELEFDVQRQQRFGNDDEWRYQRSS